MIAFVLLTSLLATDPGVSAADAHLVSGAQYFRTEQFGQALVEFQVAEKLGAKDAAWYVASAQVKLDHPDAALEAFAEADEKAPEARDALLDYYRGVACYQEKLYVCADGLFAAAESRAGPKIAGLVKALRAKIAQVLAVVPPTGAIDFYLARARSLREEKKTPLAALFAQEALALANRRPDAYRRSEAASELALANGSAAVVQHRP